MKLNRIQSRANRATLRSGFSLLELIVVVSILAILAGSAVPLSRKLIDRAARQGTLSELDELAEAAALFFEDTWRLPSSVAQLIKDPGLMGWTGPYIQTMGKDLRSGAESALVDGWSFEYQLEQSGQSVLRIISPGADGVLATLDDYAVLLDVTRIRRRRTLDSLELLNQAVAAYNDSFADEAALPLALEPLLGALVTHGLLPKSDGFRFDGWGREFVADPERLLPVVRLTSPSLKP